MADRLGRISIPIDKLLARRAVEHTVGFLLLASVLDGVSDGSTGKMAFRSEVLIHLDGWEESLACSKHLLHRDTQLATTMRWSDGGPICDDRLAMVVFHEAHEEAIQERSLGGEDVEALSCLLLLEPDGPHPGVVFKVHTPVGRAESRITGTERAGAQLVVDVA